MAAPHHSSTPPPPPATTTTINSSSARSAAAPAPHKPASRFGIPLLVPIKAKNSSPRVSPRSPRNHSFDASSSIASRPTQSSHPARNQRATSVDSPLRAGFENDQNQPRHPEQSAIDLTPRNLDRYPHGHPVFSPSNSPSQRFQPQQDTLSVPHLQPSTFNAANSTHSSRPSVERQTSSYHTANNSVSDDYAGYDIGSDYSEADPDMPVHRPADLTVNVEPSALPKRSDSIKGGRSLAKSPSTKKSFWGWGSSNRQNSMEDSPDTQFSEGTPTGDSTNIMQAPASPGYLGSGNYFEPDDGYSSRSASPMPMAANGNAASSSALLKELEEVSAELASSIRREMELEDEIDRVRTEMPSGPAEFSRRTSDYYSDSGASNSRIASVDSDLKLEGLEKMRRKAEQERAQLRVDMAQKVQDDLNQRKALEMHVQTLEAQLQSRGSQSSSSSEVEDLKRRLNEERQFKENFEDLLAGMQQEIEGHKNERDNLRDEVVPQLRARLEGLESDSSATQSLIYENTRMQQELQSLRNENQTLVNARRLQLEMQNHNPRFKSIAEEEDQNGPLSPKQGLSRSNSLARSKSTRQRSSSIYASSPKEAVSAEALPERLKDIEEQRDALHRTLKALILRQDQIVRQHSKEIRNLSNERDQALSGTPRRAAFHTEVQSLRGEVNHLRQRADDALEQKWQCEKGLSGLKMDLDRAQQETSSLRELLQERGNVRPGSSHSNSSSSLEAGIEALDKAYTELRRAHADFVGADNASEARMHQLMAQVSTQQSSNKELRERLAEAVGRGEVEQMASTQTINELQSALRAAEERVMAAQTVSEDAVASQEDHVRDIKEAAGEHTKRGIKAPPRGMAATGRNARGITLKTNGVGGNGTTSPSVFGTRSPRLHRTSSGVGVSVQEASRTVSLETRVRELEEAAGRADAEMQGVVERMNKAQIEVADLQMQRDEATRQTRRLQKEIVEERERIGS